MDYRKRNYKILLATEAISAIFGGLSIPFFLVFFYKFGGAVYSEPRSQFKEYFQQSHLIMREPFLIR